MKLHLLGLPHTQTTRETVVCAFTAKLVKFAEMMQDKFDVIVYSGSRNDAPCVEHVPLFSDEEQQAWYGGVDPNLVPSAASWKATDLCWRTMNGRAILEINQRVDRDDIILILGGNAQRVVADMFPGILSCEWAAGYEGIFSPYVCFESAAWRHYLYGRMGLGDGRWFDSVIPNFFRPEDFRVSDVKDDYLLFVGRMVQRKGVLVASQIAEASGRKLLLAGSGVVSARPGRIECEEMVLEGDHLEYVGTVNAAERNELMGKAHAVLVPTTYIEPFGAVAVEAQLCGTPAITTNWGAFTETVDEPFRFNTLKEAVECVEIAGNIDPVTLHSRVLDKYSLQSICPRYESWFRQLSSLWGDGWYADTMYQTKEI